MEKDDIKNLQKSVDLIAETTAKILSVMATKDDLDKLENKLNNKIDGVEFKLKSEIHELRTDLKSFKNEIDDSVEKIKKDVVDIVDTNMLHDSRLEKIENKVFA